ncbi:MAG TPA: DUF5677 domain-containing protein [Sedimentisphaerales bacterium]|nr:DUF5677 domain-containing protein [Sedimentisphaerales bacterium]
MIDFLNDIHWLDGIAEDAAEEMVKYRDLIEKHVNTKKNRKHPYTHFALFSFIPKVESIRYGMFEVAKKEETYSYRILQRSLIEHYCKFNYIWMRYAEERSDEVGKEYLIFGGAKESLDYIKALKDSSEMIGGMLSRSPIDILNELKPSLENVSASQLRKASARYTYKNIAKYIHQRIDKPEYTQSGLMTTILPLYSELSSFVHGGPSSLNFCRELENPAIIRSDIVESLSVTQMMAFHVQAMTFLMYYQQDKKFGEPYHVMTKYIAKISNKSES